jgi:peptidoglycan hydrolase CwlO-like protein
MKQLIINENNYFEIAIIDEVGDFVSGLTVIYDIHKSSDNSFVVSGATNEENSIYFFEYVFTELGNFRLKYITPTEYDNGFEQIVVTENYLSDINDELIDINNQLSTLSGLSALSGLSSLTGITSELENITNEIEIINDGITEINTKLGSSQTPTDYKDRNRYKI